jgi:hypothetical protein
MDSSATKESRETLAKSRLVADQAKRNAERPTIPLDNRCRAGASFAKPIRQTVRSANGLQT